MSVPQQRLSICLLLLASLISLRPRVGRAEIPGLADWLAPRAVSPSLASRASMRAGKPTRADTPAPAGASASPAADSAAPQLQAPAPEIAYSALLNLIDQHEVESVVISGQRLDGQLKNGTRFTTLNPGLRNSEVIDALIRDGARVSGAPPKASPPGDDLIHILLGGMNAALPMLLLIGAWLYLNGRQRGSSRTIDTTPMQRSPAQELAPGVVRTRLDDVAGIDEVKQEVREIVDYLREPNKYLDLGARLPRGVLLVGAPGTGKTLLARAIAGEAGVPFFSICASEFIELYVGVGAARVRDLFAKAKQHAPCIIFIDEIDAVGRHRSASAAGGSDEREQTLNQLLVEMDGFTDAEGIIVIAATNRAGVLDAALLRPGRFDRRVLVPLPDVRGREAIIRVHLRRVPVASDLTPPAIAHAAAGFSGAELANLVNEAALLAAREGAHEVAWGHFEQALDKLTLGLERRTMRPPNAERLSAAYREAGHAIVSTYLPDHDPVRKISIVPRGGSLGTAAHVPSGERVSLTRRALESRLCGLLAGRAAEELAFGDQCLTTGTADDLARANELARRMVAQYGFCEPVGPIRYVQGSDVPHARSSANGANGTAVEPNLSHETLATVDQQVRSLIERSHGRARMILESHRPALHALAGALLRLETLDGGQIQQILVQHEPHSPHNGHSSLHRRPAARSIATRVPSAALRRGYAATRCNRSVMCSCPTFANEIIAAAAPIAQQKPIGHGDPGAECICKTGTNDCGA